MGDITIKLIDRIICLIAIGVCIIGYLTYTEVPIILLSAGFIAIMGMYLIEGFTNYDKESSYQL